jgi:hypothetical protein
MLNFYWVFLGGVFAKFQLRVNKLLVFTLFLCCISVFVSAIALYLRSVCGVFVLYLQYCSSLEVEEVQGKRFHIDSRTWRPVAIHCKTVAFSPAAVFSFTKIFSKVSANAACKASCYPKCILST